MLCIIFNDTSMIFNDTFMILLSTFRKKSAITTSAHWSGCGVLKTLSFLQEVSERANTAATTIAAL